MSSFFQGLCAASLATSLIIATPAEADVRVSFDEGAPKDRFRIENTGTCTISRSSITVDLSGSQGGLVFDVTARGAGVEVFQPFELVEGAEALMGLPTVVDGQTEVRLDIARLAPNETVAFTIDVDDTLGQRGITVSGAEIEGSTVTYAQAGSLKSATFSAGSEAEVSVSNC